MWNRLKLAAPATSMMSTLVKPGLAQQREAKAQCVLSARWFLSWRGECVGPQVETNCLGLRVGCPTAVSRGPHHPKGFQSCMGMLSSLQSPQGGSDPVGGHSAYGHLCRSSLRPQEGLPAKLLSLRPITCRACPPALRLPGPPSINTGSSLASACLSTGGSGWVQPWHGHH